MKQTVEEAANNYLQKILESNTRKWKEGCFL